MNRFQVRAIALATLSFFIISTCAVEAQRNKRHPLNPVRLIRGAQKAAASECSVIIGPRFKLDGRLTQLGVQIFTPPAVESPGLLTRFDDSDGTPLNSYGQPGKILIHRGGHDAVIRGAGKMRMLEPLNYYADGWETRTQIKKAAVCGLAHRIGGEKFQHLAFFERHSDLIAGALTAPEPSVAAAYFEGRHADARKVRDTARRVEETLSSVLGEPNLINSTAQALKERQERKPVPASVPAGCDLRELRILADRMNQQLRLHAAEAQKSQHPALLILADQVQAAAQVCSPINRYQ